MPWDRTQPTAAKYRAPEHRRERTRLTAQLRRDGYLICSQPVCVMPSRVISPGQRWCVGHDDSGTQFIGPVHKVCNDRDGAVRANQRSRGVGKPQRWVV